MTTGPPAPQPGWHRTACRLANRAILAIVVTAHLGGAAGAEPARDEVVAFYPTVGHRDGVGWTLPIHGVIYKPKEDSRARAAAASLFRRMFGVQAGEGPDVFDERVRLFLVDNQRGRTISVRLGTDAYAMGTSGPDGHFWGAIRLEPAEAEASLRAPGNGAGWVMFQAVTRPGDGRVFPGKVRLLRETGVSVIADVDDTIKVTEVRNRQALLANTFVREYRAVPGMAGEFRRWAADGAAFHYVSASPWQLFGPLSRFLAAEGFPEGSFHLKHFRVKDRNFFELFRDPEAYKRWTIEPILNTFPGRRFVLVGDSGEKDPEIYGALAREHPRQVLRIFIRDVTGEAADAARYRNAFRGVARQRWMVFRNAEAIREVPLP